MIYPNIIKKDGSQRGVLIYNYKTKNSLLSVMLMDSNWEPLKDSDDSISNPIKFTDVKELNKEWETFHFE